MLENASVRPVVWYGFAKANLFLTTAFVLSCVTLVLAFAPTAAFAQAPVTEGLQAVGEAGGIAGGETDLIVIIGRIINIALGFLGIVLLVIMLYAGYEWMTSGGDAAKVDSAKTRLRNAIIGLIIIMMSFALVNFILNALLSATGGGGGVGTTGVGTPSGFGFPSAAGSLGGGIIETHVPARDATGVPRNTAIVITFKEPVKIGSFIQDYDDAGTPDDVTDDVVTEGINDAAVKIYPSGQRDRALTTAQARVRFTADRRTFVIRPVDFLGSPTENTTYTVELVAGSSPSGGPYTSVVLEDGTPAFSGAFSSGYQWQFEVSTIVDLTPPRVTSVIPHPEGRYAPNIVVQINFNEAIDPTTASGLWSGSGFDNIRVEATPAAGGATTRPNGEFRISNQYRTVEFVTDLACGTNSCGLTVYCLPTDSSIAVTALAATLSDTPPQAALTAFGYDGIVDMAGNSLDGNRDGDAQGPEIDSYSWSFGTFGGPILTPPSILSTNPAAGELGPSSNLPTDFVPQATFDSVLQSSTVNSDNVILRTNEPAEFADSFWWSLSQDFLTAAGTPAEAGEEPVQGRVSVNHRLFLPATLTATPIYQPLFRSGVQNVYQNCFNPAGSASCPADGSNPNCCDGRSQSDRCPTPRPITP